MRKVITVLLSILLVSSLAACGDNQQAGGSASEPSSELAGETLPEPEADLQTSETPSDSLAENENNTNDTGVESMGGKTLIVYYSASGNTEEVANHIASVTGGDLFEIVPAEIYSDADLDWTDKDSRVSREHDNEDERNVPLVSDTVDNWNEYDTVFIGYPIWWGEAPHIVYTLVENVSLKGKTVVPFCTSASSGMGKSAKNLKKKAAISSKTIWMKGRNFYDMPSQKIVNKWIDSLNCKK